MWSDFGLLPSSQASISDDEIRERMSEWDEDGDGSINFAEFLSAMTRILTDTDNEERMKEAFQLFDKVPCPCAKNQISISSQVRMISDLRGNAI